MSERSQIAVCPPDQRPDALRVLHDGLTEDQRIALVHALNATTSQSEDAFSGLLVAKDLQGAVWIQLAAGNTAVVWPPASSSRSAKALMEAAAAFLDENQITLAQILANPDDPCESDLFSAGGFQEFACLAYLTIGKDFFPGSQPTSDLQFEPNASEDSDRLGKLLMRTYEGTQDCPKLDGVRQPEDVLQGYAAQGTFSPDRWFFARSEDQDVGALILTEHAEGENWELVYMGVTPSGRGNGFGWQIVQFALWQAGRADVQRLILAVDEANEHALAVYRKAGFVVWDRRTVFARIC